MPVLNEDTLALLCLIEQSDTLYDDCDRIAAQTLERLLPSGDRSGVVGTVAETARSERSAFLRNIVRYCDDAPIHEHLADASVDCRDEYVARAFMVDVLCE